MELQLGVVKFGKQLVITVQGSLTEFSETALNSLHAYPEDVVTFDFERLDHINSSGVRIWTHFIKKFTDKHRVLFARCPEALVSQFQAIPLVAKQCEIVSVLGRYQCEGCRYTEKRLYELATLRQTGQRIVITDLWPCPHCSRSMASLDDEDFFDYLNTSLAKSEP